MSDRAEQYRAQRIGGGACSCRHARTHHSPQAFGQACGRRGCDCVRFEATGEEWDGS